MPVATMNFKICNFFLVNFLHIYDMKYVNILCFQIDTKKLRN
jgi:hypothetical protein